MLQRGKLAILLIFAVAFALSGYAWWHHYRSNRRSLEFWGAESIELIRSAQRVEFLALSQGEAAVDGADSSRQLTIAGQSFRVDKAADISKASGLVHARHALLSDSSFVWNGGASDCQSSWDYALRFYEGTRTATVAFDPTCGGVWWAEGQRKQTMIPSLATAFRKKGQDWLKLTGT